MEPGSAWHYICNNPCLQNLHSMERNGLASNSEKRRWLVNKAVLINGQRPGPKDQISFPITQLVFFPKSKKKRVTLL